MTQTIETTTAQFLDWLGDTKALIVTTRSPHTNNSQYTSEGSLYRVVGCEMWPDDSIPEFIEQDFSHFRSSDKDSCTVETQYWVYEVSKAQLRYVAYPVSADYCIENDVEETADIMSYVVWDEGVEVSGSAEFQEMDDKDIGCWVLQEESYYCWQDIKTEEPVVSYTLEIVEPFLSKID